MVQNILFTCAGRRNYLVNYFKEALNGQGKIIAADEVEITPALIDADIAVKVSSIYSANYISELLKVIKQHKVTALISLNDLELPLIAKNKKTFIESGVHTIISDSSIINLCFDKWETFNFLMNNNFNTPVTYIDLNKAIEAIKRGTLKFPLVLKPRWGSSSLGIHFPESLEELGLTYKLLKINIQKSILSTATESIYNSILIQEKIKGIEYGLDILNDFKGNFYGCYTKEKLLMRSGETDRAKSIIKEEFNDLGKKIGTQLKHVGNLDCDVFESENKLYVLELNPRFGGGYPFSHEAGVNIAAIYIGWLNGVSNSELEKFDNYEDNITFSKCDRLLRVK